MSDKLTTPDRIAELAAAFDESLDGPLAARRAAYEPTKITARYFQVVDRASCEAANQLLLLIVREKDGLEKVRKAGPGALGSLSRRLNAKFKPLADELDEMELQLKQKIGGFVAAERAKQEAAYRSAAQAHVEGQHSTASALLATASSAETIAPAGASVREVWTVEHIDGAALPREWMTPDTARIARYAADTPDDATPQIPGVIFRKVPAVTRRRV